jgi:hypothetical protein
LKSFDKRLSFIKETVVQKKEEIEWKSVAWVTRRGRQEQSSRIQRFHISFLSMFSDTRTRKEIFRFSSWKKE